RSINTGTIKLPDEMTYDQASFIEPLGTIARAMRTIEIKPGNSVFICGVGIAGLLMVKMARALGAGRIFVSDMSDYRLQKAKEYGADFAWKATTEDIPGLIKENNEGRGVDKSILCVGAVPPAETTLSAAGKGSTVLLFAVPKPDERVVMDFNPFWRNDITIKSCYGAAPLDNMQGCELIRSGAINVDDMITHRYGIDDIQEAFKMGAQPDGCLKVVIAPNQE
ncbi:MAG: zinc-binding dehydrogenase, partial [Fibrobacteria bacterium]|nr:zinc-binding dehydrogenase [Fibrobacteria bacterium]